MSIGKEMDRYNLSFGSGKVNRISIVIIACTEHKTDQSDPRGADSFLPSPAAKKDSYRYWCPRRIQTVTAALESRPQQPPYKGMLLLAQWKGAHHSQKGYEQLPDSCMVMKASQCTAGRPSAYCHHSMALIAKR